MSSRVGPLVRQTIRTPQLKTKIRGDLGGYKGSANYFWGVVAHRAYQYQPPGGSLPCKTGPEHKGFVAAGIIGFMIPPFLIPFAAVRFTIHKNKREDYCKWID